MPKETKYRPDDPALDAPEQVTAPATPEAPAKADEPRDDPHGVYVVVHDAVSNWVRGCRVTIDTLYHKDHPTRDGEFARLKRIGAIKPLSDPEAAAIPEAEPLPSPPPIMMATPSKELTVPLAPRS